MFKRLHFRPMHDEEIRSWYTTDFSEALQKMNENRWRIFFLLSKTGATSFGAFLTAASC